MAANCKEGKLSKYTNVMKGWQNRYFILNPANGVFEYHLNQSEVANFPNKPRGHIQLDGAVIAPSTEDSCTFTVNASNGEVYKLRALNAKERQDWVATLRAVSEYCNSQVAEDHPPLTSSSNRKPRTKSLVSNFNKFKDQVNHLSGPPSASSSQHKLSSSCNDFRGRSGSHSSISRVFTDIRNIPKPDEKNELKESWDALMSADNYLAGLAAQLENLPFQSNNVGGGGGEENGGGSSENATTATIGYVDRDVVLIKCTAAAALQSLTCAYSQLARFKQHSESILPSGAQVAWVKKASSNPAESGGGGKGGNQSDDLQPSNTLQDCLNSKPSIVVVPQLANPADELADDDDSAGGGGGKDDDDEIEENKSIIVHLISQLKLGMDLTKVTLPTFILEKRSLLEMYGDFNANTQLIAQIVTHARTPLERMNRLLKFYIASFHAGRKGSSSKKPFNPVLGEVFQCSYYVPSESNKEQKHRFRFIAEQVSHHPPISAMHLSCSDLNITMTSHIWTKSKFMNMSVGVSNIGEGVLRLADVGEEYRITYPSAYARSLLTEPWSELTGRCAIECVKSGLVASLVFHTKPSYGGEAHKVSAEVKRTKDSQVLTKVTGKWNGRLNFTYMEGDEPRSEEVDVTNLPVCTKHVRPIDKQDELESRKLWAPVSDALRSGKLEVACECKSNIEQRQRDIVKSRQQNDIVVTSTYFTKRNGDKPSYVFKGPMMQSASE